MVIFYNGRQMYSGAWPLSNNQEIHILIASPVVYIHLLVYLAGSEHFDAHLVPVCEVVVAMPICGRVQQGLTTGGLRSEGVVLSY